MYISPGYQEADYLRKGREIYYGTVRGRKIVGLDMDMWIAVRDQKPLWSLCRRAVLARRVLFPASFGVLGEVFKIQDRELRVRTAQTIRAMSLDIAFAFWNAGGGRQEARYVLANYSAKDLQYLNRWSFQSANMSGANVEDMALSDERAVAYYQGLQSVVKPTFDYVKTEGIGPRELFARQVLRYRQRAYDDIVVPAASELGLQHLLRLPWKQVISKMPTIEHMSRYMARYNQSGHTKEENHLWDLLALPVANLDAFASGDRRFRTLIDLSFRLEGGGEALGKPRLLASAVELERWLVAVLAQHGLVLEPQDARRI